jgi:aldehyde:ferredoxin oxidoreductase
MIHCIAGQILWVDLSNGKIWKEQIGRKLLREYIGGRGLNAKILWESLKPGIDPFSPENVFIISAGTLCGTIAPGASELTVTSKSPLTNLYFKTTVGGHLANELKFAGYDAIVVTGASSSPVYLSIKDEKVAIMDATDIWGNDLRETDAAVKEKEGDPETNVVGIGPAGENLVRFAVVASNIYRSASRGGLGAVMGSKKLKAIAVRGTGSIRTAKKDKFHVAALEARRQVREDEFSCRRKYLFGTQRGLLTANEVGVNPTRNFQTGHMKGVYKLGGEYIREKFVLRETGCSACESHCGKFTAVEEGPYKGSYSEGPQWETLSDWGPRIGSVDPAFVIRANELCNLYGMDVSSSSSVVAMAMELYEKGILSKEDMDGLNLEWGNLKAVESMLKKIAFREGFGDLLAEGAQRAANKIGSQANYFAIQEKGLELTAVDPRATMAYALGFAIGSRGPDHLTSEVMCQYGSTPELVKIANKLAGNQDGAKPLVSKGKARMVKWHEEMVTLSDSLGICFFHTLSTYRVDLKTMTEMFSLGTGIFMTEKEMFNSAERINNLERLINLREGLTREMDVLPKRILEEPIKGGPANGLTLPRAVLDQMVREYYRIRGWDIKTGVPNLKTLGRLGLKTLLPKLRRPEKTLEEQVLIIKSRRKDCDPK